MIVIIFGVRLAGTCIRKHHSLNQESPATLPDSISGESVKYALQYRILKSLQNYTQR